MTQQKIYRWDQSPQNNKDLVSGTHLFFPLQYAFVGSWFYIEEVPIQDAKFHVECAFGISGFII